MKYLLLLGLLLYFLDDIKNSILKLVKVDYLSTFNKFSFLKKKKTAKEIFLDISGTKKDNIIKKSYDDMKSILSSTGEISKLKRIQFVCLASGFCAALLAVYIKAYMLIPINFVGFGLIPMWALKFKQFQYRTKTNAELSVALSMITTSFILSENIIKAIEENIAHIKKPVKAPFEEFLISYKYADKNLQKNFQTLRGKINNKIFHLWIDNVLMCLQDTTHKHSLNAVVEQLDTEKSIQEEVSLSINKPIFETLAILLFSYLPMLFIPALSEKTLTEAFGTVPGQMLLIAGIIINLITINKSITLSTTPALE